MMIVVSDSRKFLSKIEDDVCQLVNDSELLYGKVRHQEGDKVFRFCESALARIEAHQIDPVENQLEMIEEDLREAYERVEWLMDEGFAPNADDDYLGNLYEPLSKVLSKFDEFNDAIQVNKLDVTDIIWAFESFVGSSIISKESVKDVLDELRNGVPEIETFKKIRDITDAYIINIKNVMKHAEAIEEAQSNIKSSIETLSNAVGIDDQDINDYLSFFSRRHAVRDVMFNEWPVREAQYIYDRSSEIIKMMES